MTAPVAILVPGDPDTRTGGTIYDRRIVAGLRELGREVAWHRLADGFPDPDRAALAHAADVLAALPDGNPTVIDGLALGAMPDEAAAEAKRLRLVALVHHPLALETGLTPARREALFHSERRALATVRRVVTTSRHTASDLAEYGAAAERIGVVVPGTDPAPLAHGSAGPPALLSVATITARKGHGVLVEALARLSDLPWTLTCAGSLDRDAATVAAVRTAVEAHGLARRIAFVGEVQGAALDALYRRSDLFVLASFHEGYGMALAEALAHGLPIVATDAGAIPSTVPAAAGLLVAPGDVGALAAALRRVLSEPVLGARLRAGAEAARSRLPSWPQAAAAFAAELDRVA